MQNTALYRVPGTSDPRFRMSGTMSKANSMLTDGEAKEEQGGGLSKPKRKSGREFSFRDMSVARAVTLQPLTAQAAFKVHASVISNTARRLRPLLLLDTQELDGVNWAPSSSVPEGAPLPRPLTHMYGRKLSYASFGSLGQPRQSVAPDLIPSLVSRMSLAPDGGLLLTAAPSPRGTKQGEATGDTRVTSGLQSHVSPVEHSLRSMPALQRPLEHAPARNPPAGGSGASHTTHTMWGGAAPGTSQAAVQPFWGAHAASGAAPPTHVPGLGFRPPPLWHQHQPASGSGLPGVAHKPPPPQLTSRISAPIFMPLDMMRSGSSLTAGGGKPLGQYTQTSNGMQQRTSGANQLLYSGDVPCTAGSPTSPAKFKSTQLAAARPQVSGPGASVTQASPIQQALHQVQGTLAAVASESVASGGDAGGHKRSGSVSPHSSQPLSAQHSLVEVSPCAIRAPHTLTTVTEAPLEPGPGPGPGRGLDALSQRSAAHALGRNAGASLWRKARDAIRQLLSKYPAPVRDMLREVGLSGALAAAF